MREVFECCVHYSAIVLCERSRERNRKMNILFRTNTHTHKQCNGLWHEKRVSNTFWVVRLLNVSSFNMLCYSRYSFILVQVFSIQLITKQSETLRDFFKFIHCCMFHMHPIYWHVNNVPSAHRNKTTRFLLFCAHIVWFLNGNPVFWHSNTFSERFLIFSAYYHCCLSSPLFQSSYLFFGLVLLRKILPFSFYVYHSLSLIYSHSLPLSAFFWLAFHLNGCCSGCHFVFYYR